MESIELSLNYRLDVDGEMVDLEVIEIRGFIARHRHAEFSTRI